MVTGLCWTDSSVISKSQVQITIRLIDFVYVRLGVERRTQIPGGNTCRRFHGTIRACSLGDTSTDDALCRQSICNLCSIIRVQPVLVSSSFLVLTHSCVAELIPALLRGHTHKLRPVWSRYLYVCDVVQGGFVSYVGANIRTVVCSTGQ
jgi:hypothetical protein